ncbi:MAG: Fe-S-containing protein [Nitrospirota bacterium]
MKKIITHHVPTIILLLIAFAALVISCSSQPHYPAPPIEGSTISIDPAMLQPEVPRFFTYRHRDKNVNFFILKVQDKVLSFLDACVTCYPKKRGYQEKEGYVLCRACDMSFSVYKLEKGLGGCYPIRISGRMEKGNYLIPLATLEGQADKF